MPHLSHTKYVLCLCVVASFLTLPSAFDLGDPRAPLGSIHPRNKRQIGQRLSAAYQVLVDKGPAEEGLGEEGEAMGGLAEGWGPWGKVMEGHAGAILPPALQRVSLQVMRLDQLPSLLADLRDAPGAVLARGWFDAGGGATMTEERSADGDAKGGGVESESDVVWVVNVTVSSTRRLVAGVFAPVRLLPSDLRRAGAYVRMRACAHTYTYINTCVCVCVVFARALSTV